MNKGVTRYLRNAWMLGMVVDELKRISSDGTTVNTIAWAGGWMGWWFRLEPDKKRDAKSRLSLSCSFVQLLAWNYSYHTECVVVGRLFLSTHLKERIRNTGTIVQVGIPFSPLRLSNRSSKKSEENFEPTEDDHVASSIPLQELIDSITPDTTWSLSGWNSLNLNWWDKFQPVKLQAWRPKRTIRPHAKSWFCDDECRTNNLNGFRIASGYHDTSSKWPWLIKRKHSHRDISHCQCQCQWHASVRLRK